MTIFHHPLVPGLILVGVLMAMSPAAAQSSRLPPPNSVEIQAQIQRSVELQREALQNLTDHGRAELLVVSAHRTLRNVLRALASNASQQKFPDPLLELNEERIQEALSHLQQASDALKANRPGVRVRQEKVGGTLGGRRVSRRRARQR